MGNETRQTAAGWPSIYDDPPTTLVGLDWSRPLFVQASRQAHFAPVHARAAFLHSLGRNRPGDA